MEPTLQQIIAMLDVDEPNYAALSVLGPEAVPHLRTLVAEENDGLAAKAAYLASLIDDPEAIEVLKAAAESSSDVVRVAAAAGLRNLAPDLAAPMVSRLLDDPDVGVRKLAIQDVSRLGLRDLEGKVDEIANKDPEETLRSLAAEQLRELRTR
jgi:HEAT repeat protein